MQTVLVGADSTSSSTHSGISSRRSTAQNGQMRPEGTAFGLLTHRKTRLKYFGRSFSSSDQAKEIGHPRSKHRNERKLSFVGSQILSPQGLANSRFLAHFAWLYALWIQNANLLLASVAPTALRYSVEMSSEYIKFHSLHHQTNSPKVMRFVYADALDTIGSSFNSESVWRSSQGVQKST
jgi:hypothetical protein